jgi:hypothetical protein
LVLPPSPLIKIKKKLKVKKFLKKFVLEFYLAIFAMQPPGGGVSLPGTNPDKVYDWDGIGWEGKTRCKNCPTP